MNQKEAPLQWLLVLQMLANQLYVNYFWTMQWEWAEGSILDTKSYISFKLKIILSTGQFMLI